MRLLYGESADIFGIKSGLMGIHTPFTTAHQLMGEELFYMMIDEPESARDVFMKIWEIYNAVFSRLSAELKIEFPNRLHMGTARHACSRRSFTEKACFL